VKEPIRRGATLSVAPGTLTTTLVLPPEGLHLGEYHLHRELGRGGMGVVYKALHRALNREVAVKLMLSDNHEDRARFRREAESSAGLKHPFIVPVHDVRIEEGKLFFAMDLIDGKTLKQVVLERRGERRLLLEIFMKICDAVGYAHAKGIIHRDLKPQNIMVDAQMNPHVMDFGLARRVGLKDLAGRGAHPATGSMAMGMIVGTPAFMPPEQAGGRTDEIDARSDIYALGVNLHFILTADVPFDAPSTLELLELIDSPAAPRAPRSQDPSCPWELERIVLKAIAKRREDRYQTAFELMDDVRAWLAGESVAAVRGGMLYELRNSVRRHRVAVGCGLLALAAIVGSAHYLVRRNHADSLDRQARAAAFVIDGAAELEVAAARLRDSEAAKVSHDPRAASYLLQQASARYARAGERFSLAIALDPESVSATAAAREALLGGAAVRLMEVKEVEDRRRAEADDQRRAREDELAADAATRLAALDPNAARSLAAARRVQHEVAAARAAFLDAVGVPRDSHAAQEGLSTLLRELAALSAREEAAARKAEVERLVAEADTAIAQAALASDHDAARLRLRRAVVALEGALRRDPDEPTARARRVDAALRLAAIAVEERNFALAEHVVDEVRELAPDRAAKFLDDMKIAREKKAP